MASLPRPHPVAVDCLGDPERVPEPPATTPLGKAELRQRDPGAAKPRLPVLGLARVARSDAAVAFRKSLAGDVVEEGDLAGGQVELGADDGEPALLCQALDHLRP